jgi:hypothetical protein
MTGCPAWTDQSSAFLAPFVQLSDPWQDIHHPFVHHPFAIVHLERGQGTDAERGDIYVAAGRKDVRFPVDDMKRDLRRFPLIACFLGARRAARLLDWLGGVGVTREKGHAPGHGPARYVPRAPR